jgi:adenylosuccinate synthase
MRRAFIVVDLGFGDAGKGLMVDHLTRARGASLVVRAHGGAQAGHTVVDPDGRSHVFSQVGAGSFVPGAATLLGPEFVFHPGAFQVEARVLAGLGVDAWARVVAHRDATLNTPFHQSAGRLRERARGAAAHGTCGVGFGEAVAGRDRDDTLTVGDLDDAARSVGALGRQRDRLVAELTGVVDPSDPVTAAEWRFLQDPTAPERVWASWEEARRRLRRVDADGGRRVLHEADVVVFEGAQGVLLDEVWGFHPHTTWSDCTTGAARRLLAGHDVAVTAIGVTRAYATRHGAGPFPSEDATLDALDEPTNGDAGWQGPFRRGWLDLVLLRYAVEVSGGVDAIAVTHLDRALPGGFRVVVAYEGPDGARTTRLDPGAPDDLDARARLAVALRAARPRLAPVDAGGIVAAIEAGVGLPVRFAARGRTSGHVTFRDNRAIG